MGKADSFISFMTKRPMARLTVGIKGVFSFSQHKLHCICLNKTSDPMFKLVRIMLPLALAAALSGRAAASELCAQLTGELTALSETYSAPAKVRKYARAIAEQKLSIRELRHGLREAGCTSGSLFVTEAASPDECGALADKMARMETNLAILNEKRLSLMTGQEADHRRERLLAALDENRCNDQPVLVNADPVPHEPESFATDLPDGYETIRVPQSQEGYGDSQFVALGGSATSGSYRTMCVRTCDGAFFPISSQATSLSFQRDAQVCSMMCPGMETELFYHSIRQETDAMRSALTGRPYGELDNAYRFRTTSGPKDKACGCNFSLYYQEMMRREAFISDPAKREPTQSSIVWVKPELRGQLDGDVAASTPVRQAKLRDYKPDTRIRQIGPQFLPDAEGVDIRAPKTTAQN